MAGLLLRNRSLVWHQLRYCGIFGCGDKIWLIHEVQWSWHYDAMLRV